MLDQQTMNHAVELYDFFRGTEAYYYTDGLEKIDFGGGLHLPESIIRGRLERNEDPFKAALTIRFPRTNEFAQTFIGSVFDQVVTVNLYRGDYETGTYVLYYKGQVVGAEADQTSIELACQSIQSSLSRNGLTAKYERLCRHSLYNAGCGVSRAANEVDVQITTQTGTTEIIVTGINQPDGYFNGGVIVDKNNNARMVTNHVSDTLTLDRPISISPLGQAKLYAGCAKDIQTCNDKFNNVVNFGGFPFIPGKNPFEGTLV